MGPPAIGRPHLLADAPPDTWNRQVTVDDAGNADQANLGILLAHWGEGCP